MLRCYGQPLVGGKRVKTTALTAEEPASSLVDTGKAKRLAGISLTSKLPSQDLRNSFSRCGHLPQHFKGEGGIITRSTGLNSLK